VILICSIIQYKPATYGTYKYPEWADAIGWLIALSSMICIPIGAVCTIYKSQGTIFEVCPKSLCICDFQLIFCSLSDCHCDQYLEVKSSCSLVVYCKWSKAQFPLYARVLNYRIYLHGKTAINVTKLKRVCLWYKLFDKHLTPIYRDCLFVFADSEGFHPTTIQSDQRRGSRWEVFVDQQFTYDLDRRKSCFCSQTHRSWRDLKALCICDVAT